MDFKQKYQRKCLLMGTVPLHVIEANLLESVLSFKFFRIPVSDWKPVLLTLESDRSLKRIQITGVTDNQAINNPTHSIKLKYLDRLLESLGNHLVENGNLVELELLGLPLSLSNVLSLSKAIAKSNSLKHISFAGSYLGDQGFKHLVDTIKMKPNIVWLDVRRSGLTNCIGEDLKSLVYFQSVARENAVWKASLRHESPNLDMMGGLRRLSLSENQLNTGVTFLSSALCEDRWIKALDLQSCNLDNSHVKQFVEAAMKNTSLVFVDMENNKGLNIDLLSQLQTCLKDNSRNSAFNFRTLSSYQKNASKNERKSKSEINKIVTTDVRAKSPLKVSSGFDLLTSTPNRLSARVNKVIRPVQERKMKQPGKKCFVNNTGSPSKEGTAKRGKHENNSLRSHQLLHRKIESAFSRISELEQSIGRIVEATSIEKTKMVSELTFIENSKNEQNITTCLRLLQEIIKELKGALNCEYKDAYLNPKPEIQKILNLLYHTFPELSSTSNLANFISTSIGSDTRTALLPQQNLVDPQIPHETNQLAENNKIMSIKYRRNHRVPSTPLESQKESNMKSDGVTITDSNISCVNFASTEADDPKKLKKRNALNWNRSTESKETKTWPCKVLRRSNVMEPQITINCVESAAETFENSKISRLVQDGVKKLKSVSPPTHENLKDKSCSTTVENSLKTLRSNLENVLQQISPECRKMKNELEDFNSQSTIKDIIPNLTMSDDEAAPTGSNYTLDFDSLSNSLKLLESSKNKNEIADSMHTIGQRDKEFDNNSHSKDKVLSNTKSMSISSSLNLSSIVDLLGNFSVGEIGSSTLTPP